MKHLFFKNNLVIFNIKKIKNLLTKSKNIFFIVIFFIVIISCTKNKNNDYISNQSKELFYNLNNEYNTAKSYNDSFVNCYYLDSSNINLINYYDNCFHKNDSLFGNCYLQLMNIHNNNSENNSGMMGGRSGMCSIQTEDINTLYTKMNQLRYNHSNIIK